MTYLANSFKDRFQRPERTRALLREWDVLLINNLLSTNSEKSASEFFGVDDNQTF